MQALMFKQVKPENLSTYLRKIDKMFPEFRVDVAISHEDISDYYRESFWGYALFHSWAGAIHMALSKGEKFAKNDYFRQAEEVADSLKKIDSGTVLEVGCGRGFNLRYLAEVFPSLNFIGVDLSETNAKSATANTKHLSNVKIHVGDFAALETVGDATISAIFAIETLCHSTDFQRTFWSLSRVLVPGGQLIVYDGFRNKFDSQPAELQKAINYTEKAMAVPIFPSIDEFRLLASSQRLTIDAVEDRSIEIMPNLIRLSDFAKAFFKFEPLSRIIKAILPAGLVTNSIAGLLMAVTVQVGAHRYLKVVLRKS
jgi:ubiquinone/menaquinone biosynthesis C-methylase UbiE